MNRFRDRHRIFLLHVGNEEVLINAEIIEYWKMKLIAIIKDYALENIYNMDGTKKIRSTKESTLQRKQPLKHLTTRNT